MMRLRLALAGLALCAQTFAGVAAAAPKERGDLFWTTPDTAALDIRSIALLPIATYDENLAARAEVDRAFGLSLKGSGHRWLGGGLSQRLLERAGGDSLVRAVRAMLTARGRVDSLAAPAIAQAVRARALLGVIVEQWEQQELEAHQSGRPSTSIRLRAALVDSTGRLLWTATGGETLEGLRKEAGETVVRVRASTLDNRPVTQSGDTPTYAETLTRIMARWAPRFPRRPGADSTAVGR